MPNYITNYLRISGERKTVDAYWPQVKEFARAKLQADPARCDLTVGDASFCETLDDNGSRLLSWDTRWVPTKEVALTSFDPVPGLRIDYFWRETDFHLPNPAPAYGRYTDYIDCAPTFDRDDAGFTEELAEDEDDPVDGPDDSIPIEWGDNVSANGFDGKYLPLTWRYPV